MSTAGRSAHGAHGTGIATTRGKAASICLGLALLTAGCAGDTNGVDINRDIARYYYSNRPREMDKASTSVKTQNQGKIRDTQDSGVLLFDAGQKGATVASSDIPWQIPAKCRRQFRRDIAGSSDVVLNQENWLKVQTGDCHTPDRSFVGLAITGGGNKSAVYATEVMFELKRYHLLDDVDAISSVSGGSFPALLYALSCDDPSDCESVRSYASDYARPQWTYTSIRDRIDTNYMSSFIWTRFRPDHLFLNATTKHGSSDDMADVLSNKFIKDSGLDRRLTFSALNDSRPALILNSSNTTETRKWFDFESDIPEGNKRHLTDDSFLHFGFTQQYFWRLLSSLDDYPLADALVASAAFPLIIDRPTLRHYRYVELDSKTRAELEPQRIKPRFVSLFDGGVHDNFGLTELQWSLECLYNRPQQGFIIPGTNKIGGRTTPKAGGRPNQALEYLPDVYNLNCGRQLNDDGSLPHTVPETVLVMGIDSSLLRSEGVSGAVAKPRGRDSYVLPVRIQGTSDSVDMIMMASGEMRKGLMRGLIHDIQNLNKRAEYTDFDIEALEFSCNEQDDDELVNLSAGATAGSRCAAFKGVLAWEVERNLHLPAAVRDFCEKLSECPRMTLFGGERAEDDTPPIIRDSAFCGADTQCSGLLERVKDRWLINNKTILVNVNDVPTAFELDEKYAWLLRYTARWVVARRVWELCTYNRALLDGLGRGKAGQVCDERLDDREVDDRAGLTAFTQ